ncbi:MAG TPA: hypothetical protein VJ552_05380 [Sediminibacterium sp.]|nr:hypothetical protein [Sediminibacterium sp.]
MTPENTAENLVKLSKPELQEKYKEVIGTPADAALTKQELADAILKHVNAGTETQNGGSNAPGGDAPNASVAGADGAGPGPDQGDPGDEQNAGSGATPETPNAGNATENTAENNVPDGHLRLVKVENGKVVDQSTMTQAAWDNLPAHKFGWSIAKPIELQ